MDDQLQDCWTYMQRGIVVTLGEEELQLWIDREAADLGISIDVALEDLDLRGLGSDFQSLLGLIRKR